MMEITVRPIHNEEDYERALAEVDALMGAELDTPEGDRLDVLATLIEAYEARHWTIEPMIGSRGRVSEALSRKRALTLPMIRRLALGLDLRADVLIQEIPITGRRAGGKHAARKPRSRS